MRDQLNGWATIEDQSNTRSGILVTADGGLTWTAAGPKGDFSCIYQTPSAIVALSRGNYSAGLISIDGGTTFASTPPLRYMNGLDFVDDFHGVATGFYDTTWKMTVDGGRTWTNISPLQRTESWSVYGVKGTSYFFACPEMDQRNIANVKKASVVYSSDYGQTWQTAVTNLFGSIGTISGTKGVLYVQTDTNRIIENGISGLFRSTDLGKSWVNVGGPSNGKDLRFAVTGCSGGVVYAFDAHGGVWKTRDGGDGALSEPPIDLQFDAASINLSGWICSKTFATVRMTNPYCEDDSLVSVSLVDSSSLLFSSGALSLVSAPNIPLLLRPNQQDSLVFEWDPSKLFHRDTVINTSVRLHYYSKILQRFIDTLVTVHLHAIGESPQASVSPTLVDFGNVNFCLNYDSLITFENLSCDTLRILGFTPSNASGYNLFDESGQPIVFPILLIPGDSARFLLRLFLDAAGTYSNRLVFHMMHQGLMRDTTIAISASMTSEGSFTLSDSLVTPAISTCTQLDTFVLIQDLGCKPLTIMSATLSSGTAFSLVGAPPFTSPIQPDSMGKVFLRFKPTATATYNDILTLTVNALGENSSIRIPLRGVGFLVPAHFVSNVPLDTLFDLALTRCDSSRQYLIHIDNPGCDSLSIISVIQSPSNDLNVTLPNLGLPVFLNSAVLGLDIPVKLAPTVLGQNTGTITIRFKLQGQAPRDTVLHYFWTVGYGARILATDLDSIDLGTMKFCETNDTIVLIRSLGCDSVSLISVSIAGNGDFSLDPVAQTVLGANASVPVRIHFEPTTSGTVTGSIMINAHADPDSIKTIPIIAHVIPTDTLDFKLTASRMTISPGDTVAFLMVPNEDVHNKGLQSIAFVLNYNGDLLTFLPQLSGSLSAQSTLLPTTTGGTPKHTTTQMLLQGIPSLDFSADVAAVKLVFAVALSDSVTSSMTISDVKLNGDDRTYAKCELGVVAADLSYGLTLACGDSTLIRYMRNLDMMSLLLSNIIPNPLTSDNNFSATLPITTRDAGEIEVQIIDQVGREVSTMTIHAEQPGVYSVPISARDLSSGLYQYEVRQKITGVTRIGRFVVIR